MRNTKKFDAVSMMRSLRDEISSRIAGMTLEEELRWLASQELNDPVLQHLRDRVTQQGILHRHPKEQRAHEYRR